MPLHAAAGHGKHAGGHDDARAVRERRGLHFLLVTATLRPMPAAANAALGDSKEEQARACFPSEGEHAPRVWGTLPNKEPVAPVSWSDIAAGGAGC